MFRRRSRFAVALGSLVVILALPAAALANTGFLVTADRASVVQGVTSSVVVSITPAIQSDVDNGCYAIQMPAAFAIQDAQITAAPSGSTWSADLQSGRVRLRSGSGDSEIEAAERLSAAITVTGTAPGAYTWTVDGYADNGCGGSHETRSILMSISPAAPAPTLVPTPVPTPRPTAPPTPKPSAAPTPVSPGQPGAPPPDPSSTSGPSSSQESGAPRASSSPGPTPSGTDRANPASGDPAGPQSPTPGAPVGGEPAALTVEVSDAGRAGAGIQTQITSSVFSAMAMLDNAFEWFVPGLTVGVPGMLILAVLGVQVLGGLAWLPAVRRTLREERRRRRPLRPAWL